MPTLKQVLERVNRVCSRRNVGLSDVEAINASITELYNKEPRINGKG